MGRRLPMKQSGHKIYIVCEGDEEYDYLSRLKELQVWSKQYSVKLKNAGSIDNIAAIYQDAYTNDNYEAVFIFCDTELAPYEQYNKLKGKLIELFGTSEAAAAVIFFCNPCTMQIILSHFEKVRLKSNQKSANRPIIERLTSVKEYRATEQQRGAITKKITAENYALLKDNIKGLSSRDNEIPSSNFMRLLSYLENDDTGWIKELSELLEGED